MYFFLKLYLGFIRLHLIVIVFLLLFSLLFNICFPYEAFAMEPNTTMDYYGQKEYIGPDAYGYFNKPGSSSNNPETEIVKSNWDLPIILKLDLVNQVFHMMWTTSHNSNNSKFTLYLAIKRRTYWYIWKIYSSEYNSYEDFKQAWNPQSSFRKDFMNDIKNAFLKRK